MRHLKTYIASNYNALFATPIVGIINANIDIQIICLLVYVCAYVLSKGSCWASASQSMVQSSIFVGLLHILYKEKLQGNCTILKLKSNVDHFHYKKKTTG